MKHLAALLLASLLVGCAGFDRGERPSLILVSDSCKVIKARAKSGGATLNWEVKLECLGD